MNGNTKNGQYWKTLTCKDTGKSYLSSSSISLSMSLWLLGARLPLMWGPSSITWTCWEKTEVPASEAFQLLSTTGRAGWVILYLARVWVWVPGGHTEYGRWVLVAVKLVGGEGDHVGCNALADALCDGKQLCNACYTVLLRLETRKCKPLASTATLVADNLRVVESLVASEDLLWAATWGGGEARQGKDTDSVSACRWLTCMECRDTDLLSVPSGRRCGLWSAQVCQLKATSKTACLAPDKWTGCYQTRGCCWAGLVSAPPKDCHLQHQHEKKPQPVNPAASYEGVASCQSSSWCFWSMFTYIWWLDGRVFCHRGLED